MEISAFDNYFHKQEEPLRSCLTAMRSLLRNYDTEITETWKYGMPFFCYKGKMFCYLWIHKKHTLPYLGIVEGLKLQDPALLQEKRTKMKIMLIDPCKNLPVKKILAILNQAVALYD